MKKVDLSNCNDEMMYQIMKQISVELGEEFQNEYLNILKSVLETMVVYYGSENSVVIKLNIQKLEDLYNKLNNNENALKIKLSATKKYFTIGIEG